VLRNGSFALAVRGGGRQCVGRSRFRLLCHISQTRSDGGDATGEEEDDDAARETLTAADMLRVFRHLRVLELKHSSLTPSSGAIIGGLLSATGAVANTPAEQTPAAAAATTAEAIKEAVPIERLYLARNTLQV